MIKNKVILNTDLVNKYGYKFTIGALEDSLELKAIEGVPTCLTHDIHRPVGWTFPFALYFEPGMCSLIGRQLIAETEEEQKNIRESHLAALYKRYSKQCDAFIPNFKEVLKDNLSTDAEYLYAGCVCCKDKNIALKMYPDLFKKADKDGLIYLSDLLEKFKYKGCGVFKDNNSGLTLIAHPFLRKSLSRHNNLNHFLIDELLKQAEKDEITARISLDPDMVGLAETYLDTIELEYWRGPKFDDDISKIKRGVAVHGCNDLQKLYSGITQTEFWWKHEEGKRTLEVEELKDHPSLGINNDSYGCRYVHSIFDEENQTFEHFDGAVRMYDTEKMLERIDNDIKSAGKDSFYTKLFRIDGKLSTADWKTMVCHYFVSNPLIHEYFGELQQDTKHLIEEPKISITEQLVPYSMQNGDGIRMMVSYHENTKNENSETEVFISGFDVSSKGVQKIKVIEADILEIIKVVKLAGGKLEIPKDIQLVCAEDLYWNIPAVMHKHTENQQNNLDLTIKALKSIFDARSASGSEQICSFTLSWETSEDKMVTLSVLGHIKDLSKWLKGNNEIPIARDNFKIWLEKQSTFINKYPIKTDKPSLFEMAHEDGVLYIKRRGIDSNIKYELKTNSVNGLLIRFYFTYEQRELAEAFKNRKIYTVPSYILKKQICSKCSGDYTSCNHSKSLTPDVNVEVRDFEMGPIYWSDRPA